MAQREHDAARNAGQVFELMRYLLAPSGHDWEMSSAPADRTSLFQPNGRRC